MRHHNVPGLLADHTQAVVDMPINAGATSGFNGLVIVEPHLLGERLEQSRDAALAFPVQVADGFGAVVTNSLAMAIREAVADEQHTCGG